MDSNAIEIRGLTKRYKDFALEDLNLDLPYGCVLGLVGENGAGKSTTIRLIMDALERDGGTVSVLGADNRRIRPPMRSGLRGWSCRRGRNSRSTPGA